jgi:multiple sugar transport system substrate-binding protein
LSLRPDAQRTEAQEIMRILSPSHRAASALGRAAALILVLLLVACSRDSGQVALTIAVNSGVEGDALKAAAKDYEAQRGIKITIAEFPYANLFEKELVDLVNRTGAYDLIMLDDPWFPRFADPELHLADLDALYAARGLSGPGEDFVKTSLALCRHPYETGKLHALPYVGNSQVYFYRRDLFEKYHLRPPERWDDVLAAARVILEKEKMHGYVMRGAQGNPVVSDFLPLFWAFGAEMFDASGQPTVNSPEGIAALKFMLELGKVTPPGYVSFNADEVAAHLLQGTAAQSINWPAWIPAFRDPAKTKVLGQVEITTLPGQQRPGQAEIGNWLLAIPEAARNKPASFDFLLWATSPEQMRLSAQRGNPPTRTSVFNDPELQAKYPSYPVQLRSLATSRPRPRTPLWNEIENAFGIFLSKANSGELTPEAALQQANEELARILERGARGQPGQPQ